MGQVTVYSARSSCCSCSSCCCCPVAAANAAPDRSAPWVALVAGAVTLLAMFAAMYAAIRGGAGPDADDSAFAVAALARNLFGPQLIPFELTGVLLLVAIVGGVSLWHRQGAERKR
jgi:NADH:ubiquinone oxidoreductase subunit 6 (subunit J)